MNRLLLALIGMTVAGVAGAKLPPLSEDAQAKAAEAKGKTAWSDKVAAYQLCVVQDKVADYQLCMTQDRIAAAYLKSKGGSKTQTATPPCQSPGAYVVAAPTAAEPSKK